MEETLSALEDRVRLAADLCQQLRTENNELRQQVAHLHNDNKRLAEKISGARERLEGLLLQIPE
jgi:cell division protein ZapB